MTWIQTYTGKQFWPLDPKPEDICIEDIAHALSMCCRFSGHVERFYSVAEHSVLVSQNVPAEHRLTALLHDAAEAYLADIASPIKLHLPDYKAIERKVDHAVAARFDLSYPWPSEVKEADTRILHDERAQLMGDPPADDWGIDLEPLGVRVVGHSPAAAKWLFLNEYERLARE